MLVSSYSSRPMTQDETRRARRSSCSSRRPTLDQTRLETSLMLDSTNDDETLLSANNVCDDSETRTIVSFHSCSWIPAGAVNPGGFDPYPVQVQMVQVRYGPTCPIPYLCYTLAIIDISHSLTICVRMVISFKIPLIED